MARGRGRRGIRGAEKKASSPLSLSLLLLPCRSSPVVPAPRRPLSSTSHLPRLAVFSLDSNWATVLVSRGYENQSLEVDDVKSE